MFCHSADGLRTKHLALEALEVRRHHLCSEVGVLAEGVAGPAPSVLCRQIDLRMKSSLETDSQVLLSQRIAEGLYQCWVSQRRETKTVRPSRERSVPIAGQDVRTDSMPGSVAMVIGIPNLVSNARCCRRLYHVAVRRGSSTMPI